MSDSSRARPSRPEFATNRNDERVADALSGFLGRLLEKWREPFEVAIATAYFNPEGFELIAEQLEQVDKTRLLLGVEPKGTDKEIRSLDGQDAPRRTEQARLNRALKGHRQNIEQDRDLLGFEYEADRRAQRLIEWLESGDVEVRLLREDFLHGKAFLVTTDSEGVLAGSSNFTYAGLARNRELNLGHYQPHVVDQVQSWFEEQWDDAEPFDLADIYKARYRPHSPYLIYLRMLYERYGDEIENEAEERGTGIHLTQFQEDGLWRARETLEEYNGVLIADGVGLGKTFLAGELMREKVEEHRQRVLLVAPASLRDGPWKTFLSNRYFNVECVSYTELAQSPQLNPEATGSGLNHDINDYAMVVIDEAHAYRNPDTLRAQTLRRLLTGSPPKDLVLLTATPVNNSLMDLYYLIHYFIRNDAAFADIGIPSMREHFKKAMAADPDALSPERLFDIVDEVAVRRTRHFVKRYYPNDTIQANGAEFQIKFPEPQVDDVTYDLEDVLPEFFERFTHALDCTEEDCEHNPPLRDEPTLSLGRYAPSRYHREEEPEFHELQLAGLLRSGILKRFESSSHAFAQTCRKMAENHEAFLELLDEGYVATGDALQEWVSTDTDEVDELVESSGELTSAEDYDSEVLAEDVRSDAQLFRAFAREAERLTPERDPKLEALVDELVEIAKQAEREGVGKEDTRTKRKVLIFSYYADTVEWVYSYLKEACRERPELSPYEGRIAKTSGREGNRDRILFGFAPKSTEAPPGRDDDLFDILVTTDVLAEGVNLQQCRHIINYDLPWNPMRLVQRHGRIDRIGSPHDRVWIRCIFPDRQLEDLLGLEERLHAKIAQAAKSIGVESEVIPGSEVSDLTYAETHEEIERLREGDATLFEEAGETGSAYSGEEYRQELRAGLERADVAERIRALPWGAGSGLVKEDADRGFVFCAQVGDRERPVFRYVNMSDASDPTLSDDALVSLSKAHATEDSVRALPDEMHELAYNAWDEARRDIYEAWMEATDHRTLQPEIPKAMRDAVRLVRGHSPRDIPQKEIDHRLNALEAPYPVRYQRMIRDAMEGADEEPRKAARAVLELVDELGLEPADAGDTLPVITEDDVHLVCWMAILPEGEAEDNA